MDNVIRAYLKGYRMTVDGDVISKTGNKLKLFNRGSGKGRAYLAFNFRHAGNNIKLSAHRLQAFQKFGMELLKDGIVVRHLDGNSMNNSYNNIGIGTQSENMMDRDVDSRVKHALHATSFVRKYDKESVRKFHKNNGNSYKITMKEFGISSKGTLHHILN